LLFGRTCEVSALAASLGADFCEIYTDVAGRGLGRDLVAHALRTVVGASEVLVETFGEDNIDGTPARRLYESLGFVPAEYLDPGP
jgi:GNAT superfamily N-acetyltransferase